MLMLERKEKWETRKGRHKEEKKFRDCNQVSGKKNCIENEIR